VQRFYYCHDPTACKVAGFMAVRAESLQENPPAARRDGDMAASKASSRNTSILCGHPVVSSKSTPWCATLQSGRGIPPPPTNATPGRMVRRFRLGLTLQFNLNHHLLIVSRQMPTPLARSWWYAHKVVG
jgi:hypothetical protein